MKKRISLVMFVALLCGVMTLTAQKPFAGRIQYETTVEGTDDPNIQSAFAGITTEYKVMGNNMKKTTLQGAKTTDVDSDPNEAKISPTASTRHHFHWSGLHRFKVFLASVYNRRGVRNH